MPRQRMVKPDFFDSETLGECSIQARLLFIGLWVMGDDYGNVPLHLKKLQRQIFPYDEISKDEFYRYMTELERVGCIKCWKSGDELFLNIPNFEVYQTVKRPSKSRTPKPPRQVAEASRTSLLSKEYPTSTPHVPHMYPTSDPKERKKEEKDSYESFSKEERHMECGADGCADSYDWQITDEEIKEMVQSWR